MVGGITDAVHQMTLSTMYIEDYADELILLTVRATERDLERHGEKLVFTKHWATTVSPIGHGEICFGISTLSKR